jgi:hypothetical protein
MTALEYWQRIAAQAHKVPELTVEVSDNRAIGGLCEFTVYLDRDPRIVQLGKPYRESSPRQQREAALWVVDAIEAAGLGYFHRTRWCDSPFEFEYGYWKLHSGGIPVHATKNEQEHLALLECLPLTLESLPAEGEK